MIMLKGTTITINHLCPDGQTLDAHRQLVQPICVIGPNLSVKPQDNVITNQCVEHEEQNEVLQLESPPIPETSFQTSLIGTEIDQQPSSVFAGIHGSGHRENRKRRRMNSSHKLRGPPQASDGCVSLLLACLSCQCTSLAVSVLQVCSFCQTTTCSCCCQTCEHCCVGLKDVPAEDLHCPAHCYTHCHAIMLEPCCEPLECLEICLECAKLCHYG